MILVLVSWNISINVSQTLENEIITIVEFVILDELSLNVAEIHILSSQINNNNNGGYTQIIIKIAMNDYR